MTSSVKCEICGKPDARVHLTQIDKQSVGKLDLCEDCAKAHGVSDPTGFERAAALVQQLGKKDHPDVQ